MGHGGRNQAHGHFYDNRSFDDLDNPSSVSRGQRRLARHDMMDYSRTLDSPRRGHFGLTRDWDYQDSQSRLSFVYPARSSSYSDVEPYRMPPKRGNDPRLDPHRRPRDGRPRKKRKTTADLLTKFADQTTLQGVLHIKNSNRWWSTAFWVLCFLAALGASLYQLTLIFQEYYGRPYSTVVKLDYAFLPFPSVTVCNMNPIRISLLQNTTAELQAFFDKYSPDNRINTKQPGQSGPNSGRTGQNTGGSGPTRQNTGGSGPTGQNTGGPGPTGQNTGGSGPTGQNTGGSGPTGQNTGGSGPTGQGGSEPTGGSGPTAPNNGGSLNPQTDGSGSPIGPGSAGGRTRGKRQLPPGPQDRGGYEPPPQQMANPDLQQLSFEVSDNYAAVDDFLNEYGNLTREEREFVGVQKDGLILDCSFNGYHCSTSNFTHSLSPRFGNCYTFNDKSEELGFEYPLQSFQSGRLYGLQLTLMVDTLEYPPGGIAEGMGIAISIHPFNTLSFPEINALSVSAGRVHSIAMRMNNITRLGSPFSNCTERDNADFQSDYGHYYTKEACLVSCYYEALVQRCGCIMAPYEVYHRPGDLTKYQQCSAANQTCIDEIHEDVRNGRIEGCNNCLPSCIEESYDIQISSAVWPDPSLSKYYSQKLVEGNGRYFQLFEEAKMSDNLEETSVEIVRDNLLQVNIYYRDLNFQQIDEKEDYPTAAFASDIGGTLGLWLGVSVITAVEIIQLATQLSCNCFKNRKRKP